MTPDSVERSVVVRCPLVTAFAVFTANFDDWWPKSHARSGDPETICVLEPWRGGRIYERTPHGVEYMWGEIVVWEPPQRLAFDWYLGSGPQQPSRVDIQFTALDTGRTRVDVVHRGPELLGELWERNQVRYAASWEVVLPAYVAGCPTD